MSEALERVIAEQQKKIDGMGKLIDSQAKSLNTVYTKHDDLFDVFAKLVEADERYRIVGLQERARLRMMDAGFCFGCHSFVCECDHD